jgi:hypothetical protein
MQDELAIVLSTIKQSKQQEAEQRLRVEQSRGASKHKNQRRVEQIRGAGQQESRKGQRNKKKTGRHESGTAPHTCVT